MKIFNRLSSHLTISSLLVNKYVIVTSIFIIWLLFFDNHNFLAQRKLSNTLRKLELEEQKYKDLIEEVKIEKIELERNKEKYARENYYLHKDNEEVFIFERKK